MTDNLMNRVTQLRRAVQLYGDTMLHGVPLHEEHKYPEKKKHLSLSFDVKRVDISRVKLVKVKFNIYSNERNVRYRKISK